MSTDKDNFSVAELTAALKYEDRAGLVNALKNKLQNLAGQRSDVVENLTPNVRKRVDALRDIQSQHDELEAKFREERAVLEAKYQTLYQPLYTKVILVRKFNFSLWRARGKLSPKSHLVFIFLESL